MMVLSSSSVCRWRLMELHRRDDWEKPGGTVSRTTWRVSAFPVRMLRKRMTGEWESRTHRLIQVYMEMNIKMVCVCVCVFERSCNYTISLKWWKHSLRNKVECRWMTWSTLIQTTIARTHIQTHNRLTKWKLIIWVTLVQNSVFSVSCCDAENDEWQEITVGV